MIHGTNDYFELSNSQINNSSNTNYQVGGSSSSDGTVGDDNAFPRFPCPYFMGNDLRVYPYTVIYLLPTIDRQLALRRFGAGLPFWYCYSCC